MLIRTSSLLKQFYKRSAWNCRFYQSIWRKADPASLFFDWDVQQLLRTLTRVDYERAFRTRKDGTSIKSPQFKFMTDEELEKTKLQVQKKLGQVLQMPPVVKEESDTDKVMYKDPALEGFSDNNYVITDISFGGSNKSRLIVVRAPDGTLRYANKMERQRMNQIYFPMEGREFHVPKMFFDPYLKNLLDREEYEFVLDRACIQFEPDDSEYHRVTQTVYTSVNASGKYDKLRSTRHFGPLAFYLAWAGHIDDLLVNVIRGEKINEAVSLIQLYHKIHPEAKSAKSTSKQSDLKLIETYVNVDARRKDEIKRAISAYLKLQNEKEKMKKNVKEAHGLVVDDHEPEMKK